MGKRQKTGNKEDENIKTKEKKLMKKSKKDTTHESLDNNEHNEKITLSEDKESPSRNEDKCIAKKKSKRKHNKSLIQENTPNKKIIFDDNAEAHEVPINKKKKEKKKVQEPEEDEPTEEDIDQFCDEINEEDNVEYENWVQLIEAKLTSNKKKT